MSETTTFMLYGWAECLENNIDNYVNEINELVEKEIQKYWDHAEGLSEEEAEFFGILETPFHVVQLGKYRVVVGEINRCLAGHVVKFFNDRKLADSIVWKPDLADVFYSVDSKWDEYFTWDLKPWMIVPESPEKEEQNV